MFTFSSIAALCALVENAYKAGSGAPGRAYGVERLKTRYEFSDRAAQLYAAAVLAENAATSARAVQTNAERLLGTWKATGSSSLADVGYGGNALSTRVEEWTFNDDLTYTYSLERMTSLMGPYGSLARPSSTRESGIWAPPDRYSAELVILLLKDGWSDRTIRVDWMGSSDDRPTVCRIDFAQFQRF
jgi:hypothetical protein